MEEERKEKKKGISFFKKVWYSTTKFDKYIEMKEEGVKKATRYLLKMIIIMAIIIAAIGIYDTNLRLDEGLKYIAQEIPDFKYAEEQLDVEVGEVIKTKEEIFDLGNVIVDTKVEEERIIEEYKSEIAKSEKGKGIIILKNKIIQIVGINEKEEIKTNEISYSYVATNLLGKGSAEFTKTDIIEFLNGAGRTYISVVNFIIYVIAYFISYLASTIVYAILLAIIGNITAIILKIKMKFKEIYSLSIYALTLPTILSLLYFIVKYFTAIQISYFDIAYVAIGYIYLVTVIFLIKTDIGRREEITIEDKKEKIENEIKKEEPKQEEG